MRKFLVFSSLMLLLSVARGELAEEIKPKSSSVPEGALRITLKEGAPLSEQGRLNSVYPVDSDGMITMWKIGKIDTRGKSHVELANAIAAAYVKAGIYEAPVFLVGKEEPKSKIAYEYISYDVPIVTIRGQVATAGAHKYEKGMTLASAVKEAGGGTKFGAVNRVRLIRNGKNYTYNLENEKHGGVKIYPNDRIEVPPKNWKGR